MFGWKIAIATLATMFNMNYNVYTNTTIVVEVDDEYVTCVDFNGTEWAFENYSDDWYVGDIATLMLCDMGTDIIYDDEIVAAGYDGWIEGPWGYDMLTNSEILTIER